MTQRSPLNPRPRPARRKAPDATVHPAAPRLAALAVDLPGPAPQPAARQPATRQPAARQPATRQPAARQPAVPQPAAAPLPADPQPAVRGGKSSGPGKNTEKKKKGKGRTPVADEVHGGPAVDLVVPVPKAMRKRLRAKAAEHGLTAEEAAFRLLRVWLDG